MLRIIGFGIFFLIFTTVFGLLNYFVIRGMTDLLKLRRPKHLWLLAIILSTTFLIANLVKSFGIFGRAFYISSVVWMGTLFILACVLAIAAVANRFSPLPQRILRPATLGLAVLLVVVALVSGNTLITKEVAIESSKILQPVRVVHLTDLHLGTVRGQGHVQNVVERTRELRPDVVVITGDLFDGPGEFNPDILKPFDTLGVPVLFVYGNHERYTGEETVNSLVANSKIVLLRNSNISVANITFLGIDDTEDAASVSQTRESLPVSDGYTVLLYHRPTPWRSIRNVDLQLSGHTHAGQIFPFTLLVLLRERPVIGLHTQGGRSLYVSPGTGTWGPPMRLGTVNQVTLIELRPTATAAES